MRLASQCHVTFFPARHQTGNCILKVASGSYLHHRDNVDMTSPWTSETVSYTKERSEQLKFSRSNPDHIDAAIHSRTERKANIIELALGLRQFESLVKSDEWIHPEDLGKMNFQQLPDGLIAVSDKIGRGSHVWKFLPSNGYALVSYRFIHDQPATSTQPKYVVEVECSEFMLIDGVSLPKRVEWKTATGFLHQVAVVEKNEIGSVNKREFMLEYPVDCRVHDDRSGTTIHMKEGGIVCRLNGSVSCHECCPRYQEG